MGRIFSTILMLDVYISSQFLLISKGINKGKNACIGKDRVRFHTGGAADLRPGAIGQSPCREAALRGRVLFETKVQTEHKRYNLVLLQMEKQLNR